MMVRAKNKLLNQKRKVSFSVGESDQDMQELARFQLWKETVEGSDTKNITLTLLRDLLKSQFKEVRSEHLRI